MMIRLVVTDLDGTLLPDGHLVPEVNVEAARKAAAAGVVVTIATGRMYRAALPVAKCLGIDAPIITYNGAMIKTVSGKILYSSFLTAEKIAEVADFMKGRGWYLQSYAHDELIYPEECEESRLYERAQQIKGTAVGWDGLKSRTDEVCKLLSITSGAEETAARIKEFNAHFDGRITAVRSNANYVEIVNPGVSKASGIKHLAEVLGIKIEETMAIGDADNDLPMLRTAGFAVAMGNAVPAVKEIADAMTTDCLEGGWAKAIYDYVLK